MMMLNMLILMSAGLVICLVTSSPVFLIFWLVLLTLNIGIMMSTYISSWLMYAMILLFTGGMMVLFTYMVTRIHSTKIIFSVGLMNIVLTWMGLFLILPTPIFWINSLVTLGDFYFLSNGAFLIFMALYLLLVLVVVIKLTAPQFGPMKSFLKNEK